MSSPECHCVRTHSAGLRASGKRLVAELPQSAILISQEWLTTVAKWTFVGPVPNGNAKTEKTLELVVVLTGWQ